MKFNKDKALKQAQDIAVEFNPKEANSFAKNHTDKQWYSDFVLLYKMVTDDNFTLDTSVYISIAGALAYFVMPIDAIQDFIPGIGFIDDVFIIGMVMKSIASEIERFKIYSGERQYVENSTDYCIDHIYS
jgi:uncharacterized membrane protein YkvA (DUF1232 family)